MKTNKKLLIILVLLILVLVVGIYRSNQLKNNSVILNTLELEKNTLAEENLKLQENIKKLEGLVGIYDKDIRQLHDYIKAPTFLAQGNEDMELLQEAYTYIKDNNHFNDSLIFQVGPIRRASNDEYAIDLYHFRIPELQNIFQNLDSYFPSELLRYSSIKVTTTTEGSKYTIGD